MPEQLDALSVVTLPAAWVTQAQAFPGHSRGASAHLQPGLRVQVPSGCSCLAGRAPDGRWAGCLGPGLVRPQSR